MDRYLAQYRHGIFKKYFLPPSEKEREDKGSTERERYVEDYTDYSIASHLTMHKTIYNHAFKDNECLSIQTKM